MTRLIVSYVFESNVVLEGNQILSTPYFLATAFESNVVLEGNQTTFRYKQFYHVFESNVVLEGIKPRRSLENVLH